MNSEIIKTLAADAIADWARTHSGSCVLSVEDGLVVAKKPTNIDLNKNKSLIVTQFAQNAGLTHASWNVVGTELLNLYNKELACRAHQKP